MKLKMLSGLQASGKSTMARDMVKKSGYQTGRINRDDLRQMMFSGKWSPANEEVIIDAEKALASVLAHHNRNAVIDDTNLTKKHLEMWKSVASELGVVFEKEFLNVPVEECIRRDLKRGKAGLPSVGRNVIIKTALRNNLIEWPDKDIVLVDIDGTLAQATGREKFLQGPKKDWTSYYQLLHTDLPMRHIFKWVKALSEDYTIVIVSGRGAEYEEATLTWFDYIWQTNPLFPELDVPRFPVFTWIFRDAGDHRPDDIVKLEYLKLLPKTPVLILDDRPRVVQAWKSRGLKVIPVQGACEDF